MILPGLARRLFLSTAGGLALSQSALYAGTLSTYSGNTVNCPANAANQSLLVRTSVYQTGKLYFEIKINSIVGTGTSTGAYAGFATAAEPITALAGGTANSIRFQVGQSYVYNNVNYGSAGSIGVTGDVIMACIDTVAGKFWGGRNGVWSQGANPATNTGGVAITAGAAWAAGVLAFADASCSVNCTWRFSASEFSYTPPTGFIAVAPSGAVVASSAPTITVAPVISAADTKVGTTATCSTGTWANSPTGYAYQWKIGTTNVGANQNTYTFQSGDISGIPTCVVTASNAAGNGSATSNALGAVVSASSGLWTPNSEPSNAFFYDPTNAANYTISGGKVTQINDLSGLGRHATQTDTGRQCTVGATAFDGVHPAFVFSGAPWYNTGIPGNLAEFLYVFALNTGTNYQALLGGPTSNMHHVAFESGGYPLIDSSGETRIGTASSPIANSTPSIVVIGRHQANGLFKFRINGVDVGNGSYSKACANATTHLLFASRTDGADTLTGQCAYAFGFSNYSTDNAIVYRAEGFIANKLGIALPAGHLYQNSPPTV